MIYSDDWICKQCWRQHSEHVKIGTPNEDGKNGEEKADFEWCFSRKNLIDAEEWETSKSNQRFEPVDNLTLVEQLAKGIIEETNKGIPPKIND